MSIYGFTVEDLIKNGRVVESDLKILKNWIQTQCLPNFSDETLALFYMACDKNIENAKKCAHGYFNAKNSGPELFDDRDTSRQDIQQQLRILNYCVLPERTDDGAVIILHRLVDTDPSQYHMDVAMKVLFMTMDVSLYDNPATGIVTLFDMHGVGLRHLTRINLSAIRKFFQYLQEGLPLKIKSIHVLNTVWFFDKVLKIAKPFMNAEIMQHLHTHTSNVNMEEFYANHIPRKCLPLDYGGDLKSVYEIQKDTERRMTELKEHFEKEQSIRTMQ